MQRRKQQTVGESSEKTECTMGRRATSTVIPYHTIHHAMSWHHSPAYPVWQFYHSSRVGLSPSSSTEAKNKIDLLPHRPDMAAPPPLEKNDVALPCPAGELLASSSMVKLRVLGEVAIGSRENVVDIWH